MQETLALQDKEIRQYNVDLIAAQASDRQRQRDNLENGRPLGTSYTQRSGYGATTSNDIGWTTQYPSLPDKSTTLYSGPQPGNNPLHYGRDRHDLRLIQSASSQSSTSNALGAGFSTQLPPNEYTFDGARYQGPSQPHAVSLPQNQRPHNRDMSQGRGMSSSETWRDIMDSNAPVTEQSRYATASSPRERTRWTCDRCQHRNDPATHSGSCAACSTRRRRYS